LDAYVTEEEMVELLKDPTEIVFEYFIELGEKLLSGDTLDRDDCTWASMCEFRKYCDYSITVKDQLWQRANLVTGGLWGYQLTEKYGLDMEKFIMTMAVLRSWYHG